MSNHTNNHPWSPPPRPRFLNRFFPLSLRENHFSHVALWVSAVGFLVLLALTLFAHRMVSDIMALKSADIGDSESRFAQRYGRLLTDLRETEDERRLLQDVRPGAGNVVPFIQLLERAAEQAGVAQTIEALPRDVDPHGQSYPSPVLRYTLTLEGPLDALTAYFSVLHELPQLVRVETVEVSSPVAGNVRVSATTTARIAVAIREDPSAPAATSGTPTGAPWGGE